MLTTKQEKTSPVRPRKPIIYRTTNTFEAWFFAVHTFTTVTLLWIFYDLLGAEPSVANWSERIQQGTACSAITCLALLLSLGPLSEHFVRLRNWTTYRRPLGFMVTIGSIPHIWMECSTYDPYLWQDIPLVLTGIIPITLLIILSILSYSWALRKLGSHTWKAIQRSAYLILFGLLLHLHATGYLASEWIQWLTDLTLPPPSTIILSTLCVIPFILKAITLIRTQLIAYIRQREAS